MRVVMIDRIEAFFPIMRRISALAGLETGCPAAARRRHESASAAAGGMSG